MQLEQVSGLGCFRNNCIFWRAGEDREEEELDNWDEAWGRRNNKKGENKCSFVWGSFKSIYIFACTKISVQQMLIASIAVNFLRPVCQAKVGYSKYVRVHSLNHRITELVRLE